MAMAYVEIILCTINLQIVPKETEMKMPLSKKQLVTQPAAAVAIALLIFS